MAKNILTVSHTPSNPVPHLAYLINAALKKRHSPDMTIPNDHKQQLYTLTGLGFTAVMTEGSRTKLCRPYFDTFTQESDSSFIPLEKLEPLSVVIAELVYNAIYPFKRLGFPRYYDDFTLAMTNTLSPSNTVTAKTKNAIQDVLLELLATC